MDRVRRTIWATFPIFYGICMQEHTYEAKLPHINGNVVAIGAVPFVTVYGVLFAVCGLQLTVSLACPFFVFRASSFGVCSCACVRWRQVACTYRLDACTPWLHAQPATRTRTCAAVMT